jgi:hypothetical protein
MRLRPVLAAACSLALAVPAASLAGPGAGEYRGDPLATGVGLNVEPVAAVAYKGGTDLEFATIKGRDYALAASQRSGGGVGGLHVIDITNPARPREVSFFPCNVTQNDVQVRGTTVLLGVDGGARDDVCFQQAGADPALGLMVVDIANPAKPRGVGFVPIAAGVHNSTWHPAGRYVYISDSELTPRTGEPASRVTGRIQVVDIADRRRPVVVSTLGLPPGLSNHDLTFNRTGSRGYAAAITQTLILDTSYPATPRIVTTILDPAVNISHGADPTPDGRFLLVTDEQAGAAANGVCNVGGVHIYDLRNELVPVKVGYYPFNPANSITATTNSQNLTCTAHVLDYAPDGTFFTNGGYAAGLRVVSTANLLATPLELGYFTATDADTWSAKTYKRKDYIFTNDLVRGFDVFRFTPGSGAVDTRTPAQRRTIAFRTTPTTLPAGSYCFTVAPPTA